MPSQEKRAYCFQFPHTKNQPSPVYVNHECELVFTVAVSPKQAANNAIYSTFNPLGERHFKDITKYLHASFDLAKFTLDIDKLDTPTIQRGLFGGQKSSHRRRDEGRLASKISEIFNISDEGENSFPKEIAREYIELRRRQPLDQ